jgi:DNA polymerase I-like protein with 3'-5' exonuclease and polymerase domains
MAKIFGDEAGFFWDAPIKVGRTAAQAGGRVVREPLKRPPAPTDYKLPSTEFPRLRDAKRIALDLETYDPNLKKLGPGCRRKDGHIVGIGVRADGWEGEYYPTGHESGPNIEPSKVYSWLQEELRDYRNVVTGANLLYDFDWLASEQVKAPLARIQDVQWAEPLLDEEAKSYKLNVLAHKHLGRGKVTEELEHLYGPAYIQNMHKVHPGHMRAYVLGDIELPELILDKQLRQLEQEKLSELFNLECRLFPLLLYMRQVGVRVDLDAAEKLNVKLATQKREVAARIRAIVGFDVDVWSADSVARAFDTQNITYPKTKPEKGNPKPSFTKPWLEAHPSELAELIANERRCDKFKGTFVENYILKGHFNGRIHALFHPLRGDDGGTVSGRFSSSNPNLQNIPIRDDILGPLLRGIFLPEPGCKWWSNDYSQIEYRLLVHFSILARCLGAETAAQMYREDPSTDFHVFASKLTGLHRKQAKNINFGIVYGMGKDEMARQMGITPEDAAPILDAYHTKLPFCKEVYKMASNRARNAGFIRTILNRKGRFNYYGPKKFTKGEEVKQLTYDQAVEKYGEGQVQRAFTHKALNRVLQGSSADITKKAMVDVWEAGLVGESAPLHLQLTVHDELDGSGDFEKKESKEALHEITHMMETAVPLKIPVLVASNTGNNWAEAH